MLSFLLRLIHGRRCGCLRWIQMSGERAGRIIAGETIKEALDVAKFQRRQLDLPRHAIKLTLQSQAAGKRNRPRRVAGSQRGDEQRAVYEGGDSRAAE